MPIKEEKKYGGETFVGYRTLFVNSKETQRLSLKYGIPPVAQFKSGWEFADTNPPSNLSDKDIFDSDLFRYNLGKFFWRNLKTNTAGLNYQFINTDINYNSNSLFPGMWGQDDNIIINKTTFASPIKYQIGFEQNYMALQDASQQAISYKEDIENVSFGSETFIILSIDTQASIGTYANLLVNNLASEYSSLTQMSQWESYLFWGKSSDDQGLSPQHLGLGNIATGDSGDIQEVGGKEVKYHDHAFIFSHPYELNDRDDLGSVKVLYADVNAEYNFYQKIYEQGLDLIRTNKISGIPAEFFLPNFNIILEESKNFTTKEALTINGVLAIEKENIDKNYLLHSTLNGRLPINILRPLETKNKKYQEVNGRSGNQYLDEWATAIMENPRGILQDDSEMRKTASKFRNVIFPLSALKNNDINILKESFPFHNEINFNTDTSTTMADILKNSKLFDILMLDYISQKGKGIAGNRIEEIDFHSYQELKLSSGAKNEGKNISFDQQFLPLSENGNKYLTYNFDGFVKLIQSLPNAWTLIESAKDAMPGTISVSEETSVDDQFEILESDPLSQLIYKMTFLSTYAAFVKDNLRTYRDIVEGKMAYNETLFYRVEKRNDEGEVIQNFYVLNDSELDDVSLIDTQIRYGKEYSYRIYAIQLVVGNEYFYKTGPPPGSELFQLLGATPANPYQIEDEYFFNFKAETKQSTRLIEVPYVQTAAVRVQEAPPVPPNINIIPYRGIDNEVLITFNIGSGEYYDKYIPILEEDEEKIEKTAITNLKGQTLFKSEGDASSFELFRISEKVMPYGPKTYQDFGIPELAKRVTLNRTFGDPTYVDAILPNTKYWYTFRTNDKKHSMNDTAPDFSNPTQVFEVQMINNSGAIYMLLNTYDVSYFDDQKTILSRQKTKTMRKYLHLKPSFDQTLINTETEDGFDYYSSKSFKSMEKYLDEATNGSVAEFKLGYTEESVFGNLKEDTNNKFKIRLTSKKTGKKIDIYLRFKKPILEK